MLEITIKGDTKEIAALVLAVQERQVEIKIESPKINCRLIDLEHRLKTMIERES